MSKTSSVIRWLVGRRCTALRPHGSRIHDYDEWLDRFETALRGLPDRQRQHSPLPLLHAFARPEKPLSGSALPADQFRAGVRAAALNKENDIPHLSQDLITKYVADLRSQRLL
ncbi:hypothetical protein ACWGGS_02285 [Streptomyces decoyicus]